MYIFVLRYAHLENFTISIDHVTCHNVLSYYEMIYHSNRLDKKE